MLGTDEVSSVGDGFFFPCRYIVVDGTWSTGLPPFGYCWMCDLFPISFYFYCFLLIALNQVTFSDICHWRELFSTGSEVSAVFLCHPGSIHDNRGVLLGDLGSENMVG